MPRRPSSAEEVGTRRRSLLDAAVAAFRERGVAGATVADIADRAGMAKGSFYTYFSSKEHLIAALRERYVEGLLARADAIFGRVGQDDLVALADELVATLVDFDLGEHEVVELFYKQGMGGDATTEEFREANRRLHEMIAVGIRVGVAAGVFDVPDPWLTAGLLNHAVHGFLEELVVHGDDVDRDAFVHAATQLVRRALGARPSVLSP